MANNFQIVISATDKATATVRKINDAMGRLTRPFQEVGKSFKSLGTELGLPKLAKGLGTVTRGATEAARGIAGIVAPMAAITGIGTISGIVALADGWAKVGRNVVYSAQNIGTGTGQLQAYEGAAKLVGIANGVMTQSLDTLGNTMEDALFGRNQQALMLFNRLGVGIKKTSTGAVDAVGQFKALAGAIYNIKNAQQQNLVAGQFGLSGLLPLIRQGPEAMDKLMAKARGLGLVLDGPALQAATDYANSLDAIKASGEGLRNSIGNALIPAVKPLVDQLTTWISNNRELVASKIGEWARDFAAWVKSIDWNQVGAASRTSSKGWVPLLEAWETGSSSWAASLRSRSHLSCLPRPPASPLLRPPLPRLPAPSSGMRPTSICWPTTGLAEALALVSPVSPRPLAAMVPARLSPSRTGADCRRHSGRPLPRTMHR